MRSAWILLALTVVRAAGQGSTNEAALEKGRKEEQRACLACHSLRIIHSNRLSRAAWNRELDKMAGWGTKYEDREAILAYLVANFGDDKPVTPPDITADGTTKK